MGNGQSVQDLIKNLKSSRPVVANKTPGVPKGRRNQVQQNPKPASTSSTDSAPAPISGEETTSTGSVSQKCPVCPVCPSI